MNSSRGQTGTKVRCESLLFTQEKTPEFTKMDEIHELCVLALSLVWFAGATPESGPQDDRLQFLMHCTRIQEAVEEGLISKSDVSAVANMLTERSLYGNEVVCSQGSLPWTAFYLGAQEAHAPQA